jgi:hypothetical protein
MACDVVFIPPIGPINAAGVIVQVGGRSGGRQVGIRVAVDEDQGLLGQILEPLLCGGDTITDLGELADAIGGLANQLQGLASLLDLLSGLDSDGAGAVGVSRQSDADSDAEEDFEDEDDEQDDEDEEDSPADKPPAKPKSKAKPSKARPR